MGSRACRLLLVEFDTLALKAQDLLGYRCQALNVDDLDAYPVCRNCSFPRLHDRLIGERPTAQAVPRQIEELEESVEALWAKWERQLLQELDKLGDKLPLLSSSERGLIEEVQQAGHLPMNQAPSSCARWAA